MRVGFKSLSLRRAWIEIRTRCRARRCKGSRSPYGERGLKLEPLGHAIAEIRSLSLRRAWIEMLKRGMLQNIESSRSPYGERGLK